VLHGFWKVKSRRLDGEARTDWTITAEFRGLRWLLMTGTGSVLSEFDLKGQTGGNNVLEF
jgi:hypothetical protein